MTKLAYKLYTIQLAKWRLAKGRNIFLINITAKSGVTAFAPSYARVMEYVRGELIPSA